MKQYILSPRQLSALESVLIGEGGKAAQYVREAFGYVKFSSTTYYYLPRSEPERREFLRLANKAGFTPEQASGNYDGPEGLTGAKRRAKVWKSKQARQ